MNAEPLQSPFRKFAFAKDADSSRGDVNLAVPMSWQFIGYFFLISIVVVLAFLVTATYARTETVEGSVVLDKGIAPIMPSRRGVVVALFAREGQQVRAGAPLAQIRAEEDMGTGGTAPQRIMEALRDQDQRLASQAELVVAAAEAERSRLTAEIKGLREEMVSLDSQIEDQERLVAVAESDYRDALAIAERGFLSRRELRDREAVFIARGQRLSELRRERASKAADRSEAERSILQVLALGQGQAASVQSSRAEIARQVAETEASQGYTLRSPIAGTVTAVVARLGQPAGQDIPVMTIVPLDGRPRIELYVPTSAAGFLALGQDVRVAVDAFPYQRFGTVSAKIVEISSTAVPKASTEGGPIPAYLVTAQMREPYVWAFGRRQPLLPGMTLKARIVTERRSLFELLFEPLFAVWRR